LGLPLVWIAYRVLTDAETNPPIEAATIPDSSLEELMILNNQELARAKADMEAGNILNPSALREIILRNKEQFFRLSADKLERETNTPALKEVVFRYTGELANLARKNASQGNPPLAVEAAQTAAEAAGNAQAGLSAAETAGNAQAGLTAAETMYAVAGPWLGISFTAVLLLTPCAGLYAYFWRK
jgi:hypothetical protein